MGLGPGHGRIQQLASLLGRRSGELLDPSDGESAAFNEHRSARRPCQRTVFAQPDAAGGNIIRDHADDDVRLGRCLALATQRQIAPALPKGPDLPGFLL